MIAVSRTNFPSGGEYAAAVQNPGVSFSDADLRGGTTELTRLGMPRAISGNFASVFALTAADGRRYAVKCFTRDVPDQRERYEAISRHLAAVAPSRLSQPWKMDFEFLPEEILVSGRRWPVMKMAWVEGIPLDRWLDAHQHDGLSIRALADRFAALVGDLESLKIAHGDLQHGNLLVASDNTLRLVDYDGMFVPELAARAAAELGHRHYQAPTRGTQDFGEKVDRFSAWVIYLSLTALAVEPTLWRFLRKPDDEHLLTSDADYQSPAGSWRLDQIASVSPEIKGIAELVRHYAQAPLDAIPALVPLPRAKPPASPGSPGSSATRTVTVNGTAPVSPGRPAWLDTHLTANEGVEPKAHYAGRSTLDRVVAAIVALSVCVSVGNAFIDFFAAADEVGAFALCVWLIGRGRRSRPEWREAKAARKSRQAQLKGLAGAAATMKRMTAEFERDDARLAKELNEIQQARANVEATRSREHTAIDKRAADAAARIGQRLRTAESAKQQSAADELRRLIDAHVFAELHRHTIVAEVGNISGLGPAAARNLAGYGIVSAADVRVSLVQGSGAYNTRMAVFQLPNGLSTRIEGIGEKKATALQSWCDGIAQRSRRTAPKALPPARQMQLDQQHKTLIDRLHAERDTIESSARSGKETVNRRLAADIVALDDRKRRTESERAVGHAAHQRNSTQVRADALEYEQVARAAELERQAQRHLNYFHYLRFSLFGF